MLATTGRLLWLLSLCYFAAAVQDGKPKAAPTAQPSSVNAKLATLAAPNRAESTDKVAATPKSRQAEVASKGVTPFGGVGNRGSDLSAKSKAAAKLSKRSRRSAATAEPSKSGSADELVATPVPDTGDKFWNNEGQFATPESDRQEQQLGAEGRRVTESPHQDSEERSVTEEPSVDDKKSSPTVKPKTDEDLGFDI